MTILDTNVVSELMRPAPAPAVVDWFSSQPGEELNVTAITVEEILYGVEILPVRKHHSTLRAGAEKMFGTIFADRIAAFDDTAVAYFPSSQRTAVPEADRLRNWTRKSRPSRELTTPRSPRAIRMILRDVACGW